MPSGRAVRVGSNSAIEAHRHLVRYTPNKQTFAREARGSESCQQQTFANQRSDEILNHTAVDEPPRGNEMSMEQEFYRGYRAQGVIWGIVPDSAVSLFLFLLR